MAFKANTMVYFYCFIGIFMVCFQLAESAGESDILMVHVVFRHGDRNPIYKSKLKESTSLLRATMFGQLTERGQARAYQLGAFLRDRYGFLTGSKYDPDVVYFRSTDYDRTLMTAQSVMAAMFLRGAAERNLGLPPFEPIPIHTEPRKSDYLAGDCDYTNEVWDNLDSHPGIAKLAVEYKELLNTIAKCTEEKEIGIRTALQIFDNLYVQTSNGMMIPSCARTFYPEPIQTMVGKAWTVEFRNTTEKVILGGPFMKEVIQHMLGNDTRRFFAYSAHDTTLAPVMSFMDAFNNLQVPLAAALIFELHNTTQGEKFVKVLYRNETDSTVRRAEPYVLNPFGCGTECKLETFVKFATPLLPNVTYQQICDNLGIERAVGSTACWLHCINMYLSVIIFFIIFKCNLI